jgi:hypothetical protein
MRAIRRSAVLLLLLGTTLGCCHTAGPPITGIPPFEILVTDSPFSVAADRRVVVDRGQVSDLYGPGSRSFDLKMPGSLGSAHVVVTAAGRDVRITVDVKTAQFARSLSLRYPAAVAVNGGRLWLARDYVHLDAARSCFAQMAGPGGDKGEIWIGALAVESENRPGPATVLEETTRVFAYAQRSGATELCSPGGKTYASTWNFPDKAGPVTYTSRVSRGSEVLLEQSESIKRFDSSATARAIDRYYETDSM